MQANTQPPKTSISLFIACTIVLAIFIIFCFAQKIDLSVADLGRHIMNGKVFFENWQPIETNFYSYTEPEHTTINHHWATGVVFHLIHQAFGFKGLSVFNILMYLSAILIFFFAAKSKSNTSIAFFFTSLSIPLLAFRTEVRPEAISCCLMAIFFVLMYLYQKEKIAFYALLISLTILEILWVNLHLFFIFGPIIVGGFWLGEIFSSKLKTNKQNKAQKLFIVFLAITLATLINPMGFYGALEPFGIFEEYGYKLAENMSVFFMHKRFPNNITYPYFEIIFLAFTMTLVALFLKKRASQLIPEILLSISIGGLACSSIRSIPIFALFFIPFISAAIFNLFYTDENKHSKHKILNTSFVILALIFILLSFVTNINHFSTKKNPYLGIGLYPGNNAAGKFFKSLNIQGPILNNYDIGGYLIYNLFPKQRVFVDNRPEAYTVSFFKDVYEPLQESESKWQEVDQSYNFNVIFFQRHDQTTHAQPFLIRRIQDQAWAPIYVDSWNIILVKRNKQNQELIKKYELPQKLFKTVENH